MKNIVCFGDSITAGRSVPENRRWTSRLQASLDALQNERWEIYNRGTPGETIVQGLERFEKEVEGLLPAVVLVEFGLNDCSHRPNRHVPRTGLPEFSATLLEVLRLVRAKQGCPVLLSNHQVDPQRIDEASGRPIHASLSPYQAVIRETAGKENLALIDVEAGFAAAGRTKQYLAADGIHLNRDGHALYEEIVRDALHPILLALP